MLLQALPLGIREVAWIGRNHAEHCSLSCCCLAYNTRSKNGIQRYRAEASAEVRERPDTIDRFGVALSPQTARPVMSGNVLLRGHCYR